MKTLVYALSILSISIYLSGSAIAAEHPGEHPGKPAKSEHPGKQAEPAKKAEHPGKTAEHPGKGAVLSADSIIKGIKGHIDGVVGKNNGYFPLADTEEGKDLLLLLVKVHEDRVSYIKKDDAYFACTDFITDDGRATYDIDFWMKKNEAGNLEVYQTKIHKKDGKPRFVYKDDEIAPVK